MGMAKVPVYTIRVAVLITMASAGTAGRRIFQTRAWSLSRLVIFAALRARISRTRLSPCERCAAGLHLASADDRASMAARASAWIGTAAEYIDVSSVGSMSIRMMSPAISSLARKWSPAATSEPTSSTTSASASACLLASCRTEQPSDKGWESGNIPLPALVARTGAPMRSAISVSGLRVPTAPPPTRINGRLACARRSAAWSIAAGSGIGTGNQFRQLFRIADHGAEGGEPGRDRGLIIELMDRSPALTLRRRRRRSGQHEHGLRVAVSLGNAGRGVGDAGAADDRANAGLAGGARIAVGHEAGALLVATLHVADPGACDAAVQLESHRPGHPEHGIHLIGRK